MKFPYTTHPEHSGKLRPFIKVILQYKRKKTTIYALADTGADCTVFERDIGKSLGINITSGRRDTMIGIGNESCPVYFHRITLIIGKYKIKTDVAFSNTSRMPFFPILGHVGFFEHFKVLFNCAQNYIDVKPFK